MPPNLPSGLGIASYHTRGLAVEPLLQRLQRHLEAGDLRELRGIVRDIEARIARFEQLKKP